VCPGLVNPEAALLLNPEAALLPNPNPEAALLVAAQQPGSRKPHYCAQPGSHIPLAPWPWLYSSDYIGYIIYIAHLADHVDPDRAKHSRFAAPCVPPRMFSPFLPTGS
jgi:hypothetical protein